MTRASKASTEEGYEEDKQSQDSWGEDWPYWNWSDNEAEAFSRSRWHTRGWTLQELIAPRVVFFLSDSWEFMGSKSELADRLEGITGIPTSVLRLERKPQDFCIAQRMFWAARRQTTRLEDEAYSLLGIFNINIPTLYGEGRKAFRRLQEEIMKQSPDTTLFAWGAWTPGPNSIGNKVPSALFAASPRDFRSSAIYYAPRARMQIQPKSLNNVSI